MLGVASGLVAFACTSFESDPGTPGPEGGPVITVDADSRDSSDAGVDAPVPADAAPDGACKGGTDQRPVARIAAGLGCIDLREVSVGDFDVFLATSPKATDAGACAENLPVVDPSCSTNNGPSNTPRNCVDWCDAFAYCAWAGKHLCGKSEGGPMKTADVNTEHDAWYRACAGDGGARTYPYGSVYDGGACTTEQNSFADVGKKAGCVTPEGVLDLTGNANEWIDSCSSEATTSECLTRGGDFGSGFEGKCTYVRPYLRGSTISQVGFRCCSD